MLAGRAPGLVCDHLNEMRQRRLVATHSRGRQRLTQVWVIGLKLAPVAKAAQRIFSIELKQVKDENLQKARLPQVWILGPRSVAVEHHFVQSVLLAKVLLYYPGPSGSLALTHFIRPELI